MRYGDVENVSGQTGHVNFGIFDVKPLDKWIQIFYCVKHSRNSPLSIPINFQKRTHIYLLLLVCGDISLNPGPVKNPCGFCWKPVAKTHRAIYCDGCFYWCHIKCAGITPDIYYRLGNDNNPWLCKTVTSFISRTLSSVKLMSAFHQILLSMRTPSTFSKNCVK